MLRRLREVLPEGVKVTVLADRGFGDVELYELLKAELGFDFVIRFRECIHVEDAKGVVRTAAEWVPPEWTRDGFEERDRHSPALRPHGRHGGEGAWDEGCLVSGHEPCGQRRGGGETLWAALLD